MADTNVANVNGGAATTLPARDEQKNDPQKDADSPKAAGIPEAMKDWVDFSEVLSSGAAKDVPFHKGSPLVYFHSEEEKEKSFRGAAASTVMECPQFITGHGQGTDHQWADSQTTKQLHEKFFKEDTAHPGQYTFDSATASASIRAHVYGDKTAKPAKSPCEICKANLEKRGIPQDSLQQGVDSTDQQQLQEGLYKRVYDSGDVVGGRAPNPTWSKVFRRA